MTKLFIEGTAVSRLLSLFHFDNNANYATLLATELEKLLVNDRTTASCQTNVSQAFRSLWSWVPEHYIKPYLFSLRTKLARDASNSLKFRRVEPARWWHVLLLPLLRTAGFLPGSWPVHSGRDFKVSPLPPPVVAVDGRRIPPGSSGFLLNLVPRVGSIAVQWEYYTNFTNIKNGL